MSRLNRIYISSILTLLSMLLLTACGGGGGGAPAVAPTTAASPSLTFTAVKTFNFKWTDVSDATHYKLLENPDGVSGFTQVGSDINQGTQVVDHVVPLYARINAQYILQSCNTAGCTDSNVIFVGSTLVGSIGYIKASNTDTLTLNRDEFGTSVSLSGDGNTLAVGAIGEDSNATGINQEETDNTATNAGAVYVFTRNGSMWAQQAYIKASNAEAQDRFGIAISLSDDGSTLAVGANFEDSNSLTINGDESNNSSLSAGAVYVYTRSGTTWAQQAYIKASNTGTNDRFGFAVSLSGDGDTLAVGATGEASKVKGINQLETDDSKAASGAVYVFSRISRSGTTWFKQAYIKASNTEASDLFGWAVSLSTDGNTLAVGARLEDSAATTIQHNVNNVSQNDNSARNSGAVFVFTRSGITWSQQAYIKAGNTDADDEFGGAVSLSGDGNTLAVGADAEDSNATGINQDKTDNSMEAAGAVYVFIRVETNGVATWGQNAYVKASNTDAGDQFGTAVSLSEDGSTLAIGAVTENGSASGIGGNQNDKITNPAYSAGAVYVFTRNGFNWDQNAYVKASNTDQVGPKIEWSDEFGTAVSLSGDGNTLAVGAIGEDGDTSGVDGDQSTNSTLSSGAVYLY